MGHSDETVPWNKGRVGVIGRSGAGKSCLVRSLLGLSNEAAEDRPESTNAVDKFECRKFDAFTGDATFLKKKETEMRVAEMFRLKKEKRVKKEERGEDQFYQEK